MPLSIAQMIAESLAPHALTVKCFEIGGVMGALLLARGFHLDVHLEPLAEETAPVTERSPVTIRSGAYLASGLTVQIAA